jgi:hypothetical protein
VVSSRRGNGEGRHGMKREHRQMLTRAEWRQITSRRSMVRRIPPPEHSHTSHTPETVAKLRVAMYYAPSRASL